ncbi:hypothetical protein [Maricaulis sp.]|uniref:hypothetical protein n=1 Tax=Maricaulis sp. TaxID=1486257 RepID=UPI0025B84F5F|nr:hypothetical protein [Maricaulis sp.]
MYWRRIQEISFGKLAVMPVIAGLVGYTMGFILSRDAGEALIWSLPVFLGFALGCALISLIKVFRTRNGAGTRVSADLEKSQ